MSVPRSAAVKFSEVLAVNDPPGVISVTSPSLPEFELETWMACATRQTKNPKAPAPRIPSPMKIAMIIRMILRALDPDFAGTGAGWAATGTGATTEAAAATGVPHDRQVWWSGCTSAPHFEQ